MNHRISLRLAGAILAPAVLVAFVIGLVLAGVLNLAPSRVGAQSGGTIQTGTGLGSGDHSPFVGVAELVLPAVVNISAEKTVRVSRHSEGEPGSPLEEMFREFFRGFPEMPFEQQRSSLGSGVIISPDGYIVTNNHVVANFDKFTVKLADETEFKGKDVKVVGRDPKTDLAVLKVSSKKPLSPIKLANPADIKVGDWAIAVGNPFGLNGTVTVGVISAKGRSGIPLPEGPSYQDFIQTDASINPGNSGGALVNIKGELVGINSAIRSPVGASVGIGFAVPVALVKSVSEQLIEGGRVVRGYMGIRPQAVDERLMKAMALTDTRGVLIAEVVEGAPAEKAGLVAGDVIVAVNGTKTEGVEQFRMQIAELAPGTNVTVDLVRDGKRLTKSVRLTEFPDNQVAAQSAEEDEPGRMWLGLSVRNLTAQERDQARVQGGVVVDEVEPGSAAAEAGVRRNDVIIEAGGEKIADVADFNRASRKETNRRRAVLLRVKRGGNTMFIAVDPTDQP
jgi:serine protease Do